MSHRRKVWQHDVQKVSEDQLREFFHNLGWEIDPIGDYGEDFLVRIFCEGNPTGQSFYIQLKGTRNIQQYALKRTSAFSYGIEVITLKQWREFPIPVIVVLWDIEQRLGYWLYTQPFIEATLNKNPHWLDAPDDGKRQIRIPSDHILCNGNANLLLQTVQEVYQATDLVKQMEHLQEGDLAIIAHLLETSGQASIVPSPQSQRSPSPKTRWQVQVARCQAVIDADPSNVEAWCEQAAAYYELYDMDKALSAINQAWELDRRDPNVIIVRGSIFAEYAIAKGGPRSMFHEAIELFECLRDEGVPRSTLDYNIGNCFAGLGDHQRAIDHYHQALAENPDPHLAAQIWKNRGTSYFHLGDHKEEVVSYRKALDLNPNLWEAFSSWAAAELRQKNFARARDLFTQALQINPELEVRGYPQLYSLAYSLWQLGDLVEAYRRVNQVLAMKPDHHDGQLLKVHLLSRLWRTDPRFLPAALVFFERHLLDNPEDKFARGELYLIHSAMGSWLKARSHLAEMASSPDASPQVLYRYATLLEEEGKFCEAIGHLERAFEESQEHHIAHSLGRLKRKTGSYREAIGFYELALRDIADPLPIVRSIADCYYFLEEYTECVRLCTMAILMDSHCEAWWTNLQYALTQLGKGSLFNIFTWHLHKLRTGQHIDDEETQAAVDELISRLRLRFGDEFVHSILAEAAAWEDAK